MPDAECLRNLNAVRRMMEQARDFIIVIKQHPREGEEYTQMMRQRLGLPRSDIVLVPKNADTLLLIRACDLMITKFSTTAMEALALDKPLLLMNFSGEPDKIDYVEQGVARGVYEPQDLSAAVENLLNNKSDIAEKRREYIARYLYKIDGKATARIIEVIEQMLREKRK
jgi:UDP-N-acetylglucosamine 2-epimerase